MELFPWRCSLVKISAETLLDAASGEADVLSKHYLLGVGDASFYPEVLLDTGA